MSSEKDEGGVFWTSRISYAVQVAILNSTTVKHLNFWCLERLDTDLLCSYNSFVIQVEILATLLKRFNVEFPPTFSQRYPPSLTFFQLVHSCSSFFVIGQSERDPLHPSKRSTTPLRLPLLGLFNPLFKINLHFMPPTCPSLLRLKENCRTLLDRDWERISSRFDQWSYSGDRTVDQTGG